MGRNRRKVYGEDGEESKACPRCGCRHLEIRKAKVGKREVEFRFCRNCGSRVG